MHGAKVASGALPVQPVHANFMLITQEDGKGGVQLGKLSWKTFLIYPRGLTKVIGATKGHCESQVRQAAHQANDTPREVLEPVNQQRLSVSGNGLRIAVELVAKQIQKHSGDRNGEHNEDEPQPRNVARAALATLL